MSPRRASRSKDLPAPPVGVETPYANCRDEWKGVGLGEKTAVVLASDAWRDVMVPILEALELERPTKGPKPAYSSEELERALLFQKLAGCKTYGAARTLLAGDRHGETRHLLGFDRPRKRYGRGLTLVRSLDGVPSEVTVWRHLQRFGLERHIEAYRQLFDRLLQEHLADPEMREEARTLNIDGSVMRSHYTSFERVNRKTGETKPATLNGGGYMPRTMGNAGKAGHGFNLVAAVTSTGLPLAYRVTPLAKVGHSEADTALAMFRGEWRAQVAPYLDAKLGILTADGAYTKPALRKELREIGYVENCHSVSHGAAERSVENAAKHDAMIFQIQGYPKWRANGHRELYCVCGSHKLARRISRDKVGRAIVRIEGSCPSCGSITITSGKWRAAQNPRQFVRVLPGDEDKTDWRFGNPFTFHDTLANKFGSARFGHGEGFHGHLVTRFGLLKGKSWHRRREQAELDFLITFSCMHALAMEQRRRARGSITPVAPAASPVTPLAPARAAPPGLAAA